MKKKIESKVKLANIWKKITIISVILLVVSFLLNAAIASNLTTTLLGVSGLLLIVCVVVYFGFRRNILKCVEILEGSGITIDEVSDDLDKGQTIGKMRKVICGDKFFSVSSPFCVFSYKEILWIYLRKTTTHDTGTGATTTNKNMIFCTAHGKKFSLNISKKLAQELVEQNREKFSPDLILGYKMKYNKQYKELVKNYK